LLGRTKQLSAVVGYGAPAELEGKVRRHGTASRKPVKTRRRKTTKAKPSSVLMPTRRGYSSAADLQVYNSIAERENWTKRWRIRLPPTKC
jgi:hypothetical protein